MMHIPIKEVIYFLLPVTLLAITACQTTEVVQKQSNPPWLPAVQKMADELLIGLNSEASSKYREQLRILKSQKSTSMDNKLSVQPSENSQIRKRRIAIVPFWKNETNVSEDFAKLLSDSLLALLIEKKHLQDAYIAREQLKEIIEDIGNFNEPSASSKKIELLLEKAGADVLIVGEVKPLENRKAVSVKYIATNVNNGEIYASTRSHQLKYNYEYSEVLSASQSIKDSAEQFSYFLGFSPDPSTKGKWQGVTTAKAKSGNLDNQFPYTLQLDGIREARSKKQTPFGKWFSSRLIAELRMRAEFAGQAISILDDSNDHKKNWGDMIKKNFKDVVSSISGKNTEALTLSGKYWVFDQKIDLLLHLKSNNGSSSTWQGEIQTETINLPVKH